MKITYDEFVKEVFDHSVTNPAWHWNQDTLLDHADPEEDILQNSTRMLKEFGTVGPMFSMEQINQGLWLLFNVSLDPSLTTCMVDLHRK